MAFQLGTGNVACDYDEIAVGVARHGLALRGGFVVAAHDNVPHCAPDVPTVTVLMIGNAGPAMWDVFAAARTAGAHPLDRWTRDIIAPIATDHGARAVYPYDVPPLPFQRWASRAWPLFPSPLGLLIDREFGLWHALRAALLFPRAIDVPALQTDTSPCATCVGKPCLTACPVDAFAEGAFDYKGCRAYLTTQPGDACLAHGCKARVACPVGAQHQYSQAQRQFHMRSYSGIVR